MGQQKIRIRLKAYDHRLLDASAEKIVETARERGRRCRPDSVADRKKHLYHSSFAPC